MPEEIRARLGPGFEEIRDLYLQPAVTDAYRLEWRAPDEAGLVEFLSDSRAFDRTRVVRAIERMNKGSS